MSKLSKFSYITTTLALVLYCFLSFSAAIAENLANSESAEHFRSGDTQHYLNIANLIENGESPFSYIANYTPHRQVLYPASLATAKFLGGYSSKNLARVNTLFSCLSVLLIIAIAVNIFGNPLAGIFAAMIFLSNNFYVRNATSRLLTEPLFILLTFLMIYAFLKYLKEGEVKNFYGAVAAGGLAYLVRPNGLFLTASLICTVVLFELLFRFRDRNWQDLAKKLAACVAVFLVVSALSWVPRVYYKGNPLDHGSLTNYLWTDSYEQAHTTSVRYSFSDYASSHDLKDVYNRVEYGLDRVYLKTPYHKIKFWPSVLMFLGLVLAVFTRNRIILALFFLMFVQLLPIVWTALPNPTLRIPAAAMLPFGIVFATYFFHTTLLALRRAIREYLF